MRILHVISGLDPENGGPTTALIGLAEAQVAVGLEVAVIATWQRQSGFANAERMKARGIDVRLVGPAHGKLSRYKGLTGVVTTEVARASVVHIHALWEEVQYRASEAARRGGVPYVVTPHGMLSEWSFKTNRLVKRLYFEWRLRRNLNEAAAIHYITQAEQQLAAWHRLTAPVIVEPCGVDLSEFANPSEPNAFRAAFLPAPPGPIVLFLGRLSPQKGLDILIPAFAAFTRLAPSDATLVLAGPDYDGYEAQVRRWVTAHQLERRVVFTGLLNGTQRVTALREAALLVLPSRHENFGIVVAEALAAGTPVLISNEVNICQEIETAGAGGVVAPTVDAVAAGLVEWMSDTARREVAGERGCAFVSQRYNWKTIARNWVEHYHRLAGKKVARDSPDAQRSR